MSGIYLYYRFLLICMLVFLIFLTIKFVVNFIKINGIKTIFLSIFNIENRLMLFVSGVFLLIFWISFYYIYYIRVSPSIRITEEISNNETTEVYMNSCVVGSDECKNINLNINAFENKKIDIVKYSRNYIIFKIDNPMYVRKCDNCNINILDVNTEYKLVLNEKMYLEPINNSENYHTYYIVGLD